MRVVGKEVRTVYGWTDNGVVFLSLKDKSEPHRPANRYGSRGEAEAYAQARGVAIEWEDGSQDA